MASYREEQKDEIEALESIYPDSFEANHSKKLIGESYFALMSSDEQSDASGLVETDADDGGEDESVPPLSVGVQFTFPPTYPNESPLFEVLDYQGFPSDSLVIQINELVTGQIEENLGMVMIFTIVSAVQEFLNQARDEMIGAIKEEKERKEREAREAEERKCRGTPVTVASFLAWKTRFDAELLELEKKVQAAKKEKKLSGREIFLQMKNISDDSELLEGESEAVEVDESLFEALDDLDLEEDLA